MAEQGDYKGPGIKRYDDGSIRAKDRRFWKHG